ncbi:MAG: type I glyceraldehyde-3-phosphate dehydrogenase [Firmicutes bacterium]|nr:type I glyceraldehyde-3-phosphate dehydrogenase [Bacillota bacterium]
MIKVGINGFGSIGRRFLRIADKQNDFEIVAVNDLTDAQTLAYLLKYDSNYGIYEKDVKAGEGQILIDGKPIAVLAERNPADIPWSRYGVDIVVESTGFFTDAAQARAHIEQGGAQRVIISAPAKGEDITIVLGVNEKKFDPSRDFILSNASCTTNCLAPVAKVLDETFGIVSGMMTTVHSYTNDQRLLDLPHKDLRRARAAAVNIIPTSTGAARALHLVLPQLKGKLNGISLRVPTPVVSIVDLTITSEKPLSADAVNRAFYEAAAGELKGILQYSDQPLVSSDYKGNAHSSIFDSLETLAIGEHMVKVMAWYDNEWGYANRLVDLTALVAREGGRS